jgi:hypothetical protein
MASPWKNTCPRRTSGTRLAPTPKPRQSPSSEAVRGQGGTPLGCSSSTTVTLGSGMHAEEVQRLVILLHRIRSLWKRRHQVLATPCDKGQCGGCGGLRESRMCQGASAARGWGGGRASRRWCARRGGGDGGAHIATREWRW